MLFNMFSFHNLHRKYHCFQSFALHGKSSCARLTGSLQQNLCQTVESLHPVSACFGVHRAFGSPISGVTITHAQDAYRTVHRNLQVPTGSRHETSLLVLQFHPAHRHVLIVGSYRGTVDRKHHGCCLTGTFKDTRERPLTSGRTVTAMRWNSL